MRGQRAWQALCRQLERRIGKRPREVGKVQARLLGVLTVAAQHGGQAAPEPRTEAAEGPADGDINAGRGAARTCWCQNALAGACPPLLADAAPQAKAPRSANAAPSPKRNQGDTRNNAPRSDALGLVKMDREAPKMEQEPVSEALALPSSSLAPSWTPFFHSACAPPAAMSHWSDASGPTPRRWQDRPGAG